MVRPDDIVGTMMAVQSSALDPALAAFSIKTLLLDLPLAVGLEAAGFNMRLTATWLEHLSRLSELHRENGGHGSRGAAAAKPPAVAASSQLVA